MVFKGKSTPALLSDVLGIDATVNICMDWEHFRPTGNKQSESKNDGEVDNENDSVENMESKEKKNQKTYLQASVFKENVGIGSYKNKKVSEPIQIDETMEEDTIQTLEKMGLNDHPEIWISAVYTLMINKTSDKKDI